MTMWTCFRCLAQHEVVNGVIQCPKIDEPMKTIAQEDWEAIKKWLRSTSNPLNNL